MELNVIPFNQTLKPEKELDEDGDVVEPRHLCELPAEPVVMNPRKKSTSQLSLRYGECMRNHAASIGGHASDGCGEFMPRTADPLTCAACGCHRNFHRREFPGGDQLQHHYAVHSPPPLLLYAPGHSKSPMIGNHLGLGLSQHFRNGGGRAMGGVDLRDQYHEMNEYDRRSETPDERGEMQMGSTARGKRFRTKFTQEQKERMLAFAESIGWRMQRNEEAALNHFCSEIGVKRNVLKVWMHNNKSAHRRREEQPMTQSPCPSPPHPPPEAELIGA